MGHDDADESLAGRLAFDLEEIAQDHEESRDQAVADTNPAVELQEDH